MGGTLVEPSPKDGSEVISDETGSRKGPTLTTEGGQVKRKRNLPERRRRGHAPKIIRMINLVDCEVGGAVGDVGFC